MPGHGRSGEHKSSSSSPSSSSSSSSSSQEGVKIAFYDCTPYFRQYFSQVSSSLPFPVHYKWINDRLSAETVEQASGCPVICVFVSDKVGRSVAQKLAQQGAKLIVMRGAGFNNIDVAACDELGLTVARVPAYSPYAVAEMATTLILALNRKVHRAYARVRDYNFSLDRLVGFDMHGKTIGVLGTGKIGQCFIDIMLGFGCHVICYDVQKAKALESRKDVKYVSMDEVFKQSDVLSLHLPLTPDTKHIVSDRTLALMKPTALIINTGRGALIDTPALLTSLRSEHIAGAGLDVYEEEGDFFYENLSEHVMKDRELLELINQPNCIVTSHQGFLTAEALTAIASTTLANVGEWMEGKRMGQLKNSVNKKENDKQGLDGVKMNNTNGHDGEWDIVARNTKAMKEAKVKFMARL